MPYKWHTEAVLLRTYHWVEYSHFHAILISFRARKYSIKAVRDQMLTTLENLPHIHPFDADISPLSTIMFGIGLGR